MAVDAAAASANSTATTSATLAGRTRLADNFQTFLTLLTTQLNNQDPMSPLDSNEFTAQLVQMSGVEQQLLTNDLLKNLVDSSSNGIADAVSLIGKEIRATSDVAGLQKGKADWAYNLPRDATDVKLEILDASGKTVHSENLTDVTAGEHTLSWNGKDNSGKQLADGGQYTLKITALDSAGAAVPTTTYVDGVVSAVEQADGKTWITVKGAKVLWDMVTKIAQQAEADTAATSNTNATTAANTNNTDNEDQAA